jgi:signal transduction histidine kinase
MLRRALTDLLEDAGHAVDVHGRWESVGLRILAEPAADASRPRTPTLYFRPGRRGRAALAPGPALVTALHTGGTATWAPPLDADLLVQCLREPGPAPRRAAAVPAEAPIARAPDPWLLLDPRTRDVVWATDAARARFVLPGGERLSLRGEEAVPPSVYDRGDGSEVRPVDGVPHLVLWWTDARGRRCVGLLRVAAPAGEENSATLAELGRVSAVTMHELRNPLASFAGALDLVAREPDAGEREAVVRMARERLSQMKSMLDDALRLVRPFRAPPEPVHAEEVVRSAVGAARTQDLFERVDVSVNAAPAMRPVLAHPEPLRRALVNLLVNAAQAQGGSGRVRVHVDAAGPCGRIRIEDDGPGIPSAAREKVFDPFWTTKEGGTGLGLSYVKRVAEASGGRACVEEVAHGACVRIDLPLAPSE